MKNPLLIPFLLVPFLLPAQYSPLIGEDKLWVDFYSEQDLDVIFGPDETLTFNYFQGESTINNSTYHNLYTQRFYYKTYSDNGDLIIDTTLQAPIISYFREDTMERKVYRYFENEEILWLDYSTEVGDSIFDQGFGAYIYLDSINNVLLEDGTERKKFWYSSADSEDITGQYIEGVGSEFGLLNPNNYLLISGFTEYGLLNCYLENDIALYGECNYGQTVMSGTSEEVVPGQNALVYPNPSTDLVFIDLGERLKHSTIELFNAQGQLIQVLETNQVRIQPLALDQVPVGSYIVRISVDGQSIKTIRLIRQ